MYKLLSIFVFSFLISVVSTSTYSQTSEEEELDRLREQIEAEMMEFMMPNGVEEEQPQELTEVPPEVQVQPNGKKPGAGNQSIDQAIDDEYQAVVDAGVFSECDFCPQMKIIPAGSFMMGSVNADGLATSDFERERESPQHRVTIANDFAVSIFEITFAQWDACVADGGCGGHSPDDEGWGRDNQPVINVSLRDANEYVKWLRDKTGTFYRLITEAEWEYVARAGTTTTYYWGNRASHGRANYGTDTCCDMAQASADKWLGSSPVGSFAPNAFGIYDMHGNVTEMVEDCYHSTYSGAPADGSVWLEENEGDCSRGVVRSGSYYEHPFAIRSAARFASEEGGRHETVGFRIAMTIY